MEFHPSLFKLCLWVCFVILQGHRCFGGCAGDERAALMKIKASRPDDLVPDDLFTWVEDNTSDYCAWARIKCSDTTGCVSQLDLGAMALGDSLFSASLFLPFKDLQYLDISANGFNGWKSHQGIGKLAKLKKLQVLKLGDNQFNINVLEPLSELASLKTLYLDGNYLGDSSLSEISQGILKLSNLENLEVLNLCANEFNNNILAPLSEITSLKTLYLGHNYIGEGSTSEISQGFENLSKLKRLQCLDLKDNYLNDTSILVSLSKLMSLQNLNLSSNQLRMGSSIEVSQGFCELKKLQGIDLSDNYLTGEIPLCLVNFTSLKMLDLSRNQLGGNIPASLTSNMTSLKRLDLSDNHFTGTTWITSSLEQNFQINYLRLSNCNLNTSTTSLLKFLHGQSELRFIDLSHNNIHGNYPNWLVENNTKLDTIVLNNNSLSGDIRFPLHRRTNLRFIDASENHIEGHLQTNLGQVLQRVEYLYLSQNHLEGSLPTSLGNMQNLWALDLSTNNFTGELPGSLAGLPIAYLILSNNRLHGQIFLTPSYYGAIRLNNNQFTGIVPHNTNTDWSLHMLDVSKNSISGRIPSWIANFTNLAALVMGDNFFHGSIPLELCNLASLENFDLSQNELSGNIPSCLNLSSLSHMEFQGNKLSGSLPSALLRSPYLTTLNLNHNHFSGSIPGWLSLLEDLRILLLNRNHLSGFVPYELCRLSKISIMDLSHNGLSGKIPPCLSNISFGPSGELEHYGSIDEYDIPLSRFNYSNIDLSYTAIVSKPFVRQEEVEFMTKGVSRSYKGDILNYMSGMDLSCNNFTGHIPHELEALTEIHALNLSHNQLTGPIPKALSKLKQLESMDLSHNKFSGEIPSELTDLNFLGTFSVAYNNLSGRVPTMSRQFSTFTETSYQGNRYLCGPPLLKQCNSAAAPTGSVTATDAALSDIFGVNPISFLASCAGAYVMSLLALVIVLYINPYWRRLWFDFIDACLRFMFPFWAEAFHRVANPFT